MNRIFPSMERLIGGTPLIELGRLRRRLGFSGRILAKMESLNPAGSVKDRAVLAMIDDAERRGSLRPGGTVIEPTSGNTGVGLAAIGAARGYRVVIVMPDTMSTERRGLLSLYGAEVILTDGTLGMAGAIARAEELRDRIPGSVILGQFENPANPAAHFASTGPEIWRDTGGQVDLFVAGIGTGGTVTGVGRFLKERDPAIKVFGVEPRSSPLLSGGTAGPHGIQGIGAGFVPAVFDGNFCDGILTATEEDAFAMAGMLARTEGIPAGISSGAAVWAAVELARRAEYAGKVTVVLLPDGGERYLSVPRFTG